MFVFVFTIPERKRRPKMRRASNVVKTKSEIRFYYMQGRERCQAKNWKKDWLTNELEYTNIFGSLCTVTFLFLYNYKWANPEKCTNAPIYIERAFWAKISCKIQFLKSLYPSSNEPTHPETVQHRKWTSERISHILVMPCFLRSWHLSKASFCLQLRKNTSIFQRLA